MNYLKLFEDFEDFEEKPFYIIKHNEYINMFDYIINLDDYTKDIIGTIKKILPKAFGHDRFSCFIMDDKYKVFICESLNSLVEYTFYVTEDDWIYLYSINLNAGIFYYKCDGIKGLIEAIKYDFETNQSNTKLWFRIHIDNYGSLKTRFTNCDKELLRTPIQFYMTEFPKQEVQQGVESILHNSTFNNLPIKIKLKLVGKKDSKEIYELTFYVEKNNGEELELITSPIYYIKELNRFILLNAHPDDDLIRKECYICCGVEGLKQVILDELIKTF